MQLSITYSAYKELEMVPPEILRSIGEEIMSLADDPTPKKSSPLAGNPGCYYVAVDDYYILYHIPQNEESLCVLGVLCGPYHPLH